MKYSYLNKDIMCNSYRARSWNAKMREKLIPETSR
jgi:hypothetical protein